MSENAELVEGVMRARRNLAEDQDLAWGANLTLDETREALMYLQSQGRAMAEERELGTRTVTLWRLPSPGEKAANDVRVAQRKREAPPEGGPALVGELRAPGDEDRETMARRLSHLPPAALFALFTRILGDLDAEQWADLAVHVDEARTASPMPGQLGLDVGRWLMGHAGGAAPENLAGLHVASVEIAGIAGVKHRLADLAELAEQPGDAVKREHAPVLRSASRVLYALASVIEEATA